MSPKGGRTKLGIGPFPCPSCPRRTDPVRGPRPSPVTPCSTEGTPLETVDLFVNRHTKRNPPRPSLCPLTGSTGGSTGGGPPTKSLSSDPFETYRPDRRNPHGPTSSLRIGHLFVSTTPVRFPVQRPGRIRSQSEGVLGHQTPGSSVTYIPLYA